MNLLGYLAITALIVLGAWIILDGLRILYSIVQDKQTKIKEEMENNDADRESGEDL